MQANLFSTISPNKQAELYKVSCSDVCQTSSTFASQIVSDVPPVPLYLLSYAFWETFLLSPTSPLSSQRERIAEAALGYLRTYFYLVQHASDFCIALEERLLPDSTTWTGFCDFSRDLQDIGDANVSKRHSYGLLRLSRLNLYAKIFLRKFYFQRLHPQYGAYFAQFYAPLLFVFGVISVILSAIQVETAVEQLLPAQSVWVRFWLACRWFSISTLVLVLLIVSGLSFLFSYRFSREWHVAISTRLEKRREQSRRLNMED
ncbi:hypothetical protein MPH_10125 [Macrophomina phaseolina MS6]|uniref:Uncharacterized protein n=1 Tax=Macrophomina phaseolina (strain MS6) TaxID=1126212 RepID=K2RRA4_MACPH|nr:hypothetical protein MPH_10125 [Macrophomina phaseolina MS6]